MEDGTCAASPFELCWQFLEWTWSACGERGVPSLHSCHLVVFVVLDRIFNAFELTLARVWKVC